MIVPFSAAAFEAFFNRFASPLRLPEHAKRWVHEAIENPNLLLNVPPRFAKSTILAEWFPIWILCRDRQATIILVSKTTSLSEKLSRKIEGSLSPDIVCDGVERAHTAGIGLISESAFERGRASAGRR